MLRKDAASSGSPQMTLLIDIELGVNAVDIELLYPLQRYKQPLMA